MSDDSARRELETACDRAGIRRLTPHSLRGGAATAAIATGVPHLAVMAAGRWKSQSGFAPYVEKSIATLQGAANLI